MTIEELENYIPKGDLKGFPREIIARMLECQEEQGNKIDVSVFERDNCNSITKGGFYWPDTKEGSEFWSEVIRKKDFALFFEEYYHKKQETKVCSKCHKENPVSEFHKKGNTVRPECKECRKQEYQESKTTKYVQVGDNAILSDITSTQSSVETEINTTKDNSQEFRVGDKVYDILLQEVGVVQDITYSPNIVYGLTVGFKLGLKIYTTNGCYVHECKNPQLLHYRNDYNYDVINFNNLPKRQEPKRWRAKEEGVYYFVNFYAKDWFFSDETKDYYDPIDNENYNSGNYFRTEVEVEIISQKLNEYLKQLIKEEHEYEKH